MEPTDSSNRTPPAFPRGVVLFAVALVVAIGSLALRNGFSFEDRIQIATLEGDAPACMSHTSLWRFLSGEVADTQRLIRDGWVPWWIGLRTQWALWRPVASVDIALDHHLWGVHSAGYFAHGLLWLAGLVLVTGVLYRSLRLGAVGAWATLIFAMHWSLAEITTRVCTRHLLIASLSGCVALAAHVVGRRDGRRSARWIALAAFAISLLSSEAGLQFLGYIAAYEMIGAQDDRFARVRALLPFLGLTVGHLVLYRLLGYGTRDMAEYIDPLRHPLEIAHAVPRRMVAIVEFSLGLTRSGRWAPVGAFVIVVTCAAFAWRLRSFPAPQRRTALWLAVGALFSIVPSLGADPAPRSSLIPRIGSSVVVAIVASALVASMAPDTVSRARFARIAQTAVALMLVAVHLVLSPVAFVMGEIASRRLDLARDRDVEDRLRSVEASMLAAGPVVVLAASPDLVPMLFQLASRHRSIDHAWRFVTPSDCRQTVRRLDASTLEIAPIDATCRMVPADGAWYPGAASDVRTGETRVLGAGLLLRVTAATDGELRRFRLETANGADLDAWVFVDGDTEGNLRRIVLPAPGGQTIVGG